MTSLMTRIGAPIWPPPSTAALRNIFLISLMLNSVALAQERLMGGLISTRDIAELTQIATQLAAQTMSSNGELLSKAGRPEVKPLSLNARPSELMSQSLTNMIQPATEQIARVLSGSSSKIPSSSQQQTLFSGASNSQPNSIFTRALSRTELPANDLPAEFSAPSAQRPLGNGMSSLFDLASSFLRQTKGADGQPLSTQQQIIPTLKQLMPGASRNFGFQQGEGCLPFIGEFMQVIYGNCVKQADERTWDTWGKEITNALMGGKIDLLRASKETCKKGAEREQCGQLRRAVSDCDILGSIQLASNMKRAIDRCDEISGIIDQNPMTLMKQMSGFMNGEMAQGFLNNFLGK